MKKRDFQKIKEIFSQVVEFPATRQNDLLKKLCGDDSFLLEEVQSLLDSHNSTEKIIEKNAFDFRLLTDIQSTNYEGIEFGHYKIISEIGHGGMGAVFLAERNDGEFDQQVALKIVRQTVVTQDIERYFRRERQILASLNHPNIAKLLDGGVSKRGEPYLAMEYIKGKPFLEFAENISINDKLKLFLKVCHAVSFAHRNLVIHRDIKPSNILVTQDGEPKLLDFGLAKIEDANFSTDITQTAFRALTPAYASPEQLKGEAITTASDIYSLGVVFYELLTGDKPFHFEGKSLQKIINTLSYSEPQMPSTITNFQNQKNPKSGMQNLKVKGDLDNIALTALCKEPERRYKTVELFADDIERHLKGLPISARPNTLKYRAEKFFQRNKALVFTASIVILSLFTGLIFSLWQANIAHQQRDRAERRFNDVRKLSNSLLFEITPKIERLQGSVEAREILVKRAIEYLDSLADESNSDAELQSELASAYEKIGELQGNSAKPNLNDFSGAIASFEKAQIIRQILPETPENRRLLAENFVGISNAHYSQNEISKTLEDLQKAKEIYESLIIEDPSFDLKIANINVQLELGATHSNNNQYQTAIPIFQNALKLLGNLDPENIETQKFIAKAFAQLGNALSWSDKQTEAEINLAKSVKIIENLLGKYPKDMSIRRTAFQIYGLNSNDYEDVNNVIALKFAEKFMEIAAQDTKADSFDIQAKTNLARAYSRVGICLVNTNQLNAAISKLRESEKILFELKTQEPKNKTYQRDLAILYVRLGDAEAKLKDLPKALDSYNKSADLFEDIAKSDNKNTLAQRDLAQSLKNVGVIQLKLNEPHKARETYQMSLKILDSLKNQKALGDFDNNLYKDVQAALRNL